MLPSGLPDLVHDSEMVARFLTQSSHFNTKGPKVRAFLPETDARETSVCRLGQLSTQSLWHLAASSLPDRKIYGAAMILAKAIRSVIPLDVVSDEPPNQHAAIRKWPWDEADSDMGIARHREMALELVRNTAEVLWVQS
jgi:hypothetical protein